MLLVWQLLTIIWNLVDHVCETAINIDHRIQGLVCSQVSDTSAKSFSHVTARGKEQNCKETLTPFSDHNGGRLKQYPKQRAQHCWVIASNHMSFNHLQNLQKQHKCWQSQLSHQSYNHQNTCQQAWSTSSSKQTQHKHLAHMAIISTKQHFCTFTQNSAASYTSARPIKPPGVTYGLREPPAYQHTLSSRLIDTYNRMQMTTARLSKVV